MDLSPSVRAAEEVLEGHVRAPKFKRKALERKGKTTPDEEPGDLLAEDLS
jgi:hypothetical protein